MVENISEIVDIPTNQIQLTEEQKSDDFLIECDREIHDEMLWKLEEYLKRHQIIKEEEFEKKN
jgi:fructose-1,6-bisphosphatase/inositol monophosphatase family enzyme